MNDFVEPTDAIASFSWEGAPSAATALVEAVCEATGARPTELPPLYDSIAPEALDAALAGLANDAGAGRIEFSYDDYRVTMTADGGGWIAERDAVADA